MRSRGDSLGPFVVVRRLGQGGMGQTYLCVRPGVDQRVCVKVMRPELREQAETQALFKREAVLAASLRHPGIASVVAVDDDGTFVAYEYIDGCDLRKLLCSDPFTPELTAYLLCQVCRALEYAHNRRLGGVPSPVIHRDVSPGNVMVDRWGNVKLIDFGVAKAMTEGPSCSLSVKGKLTYMSPEQATSCAVDGRTDQYSLGVVAYEMLVGQRPHDGADDRETLARLLTGAHLPCDQRVSGLPRGLAAVVERMLATDPAARYASITEVFDALAPFAPAPAAYRALAARVRAASAPMTIATAVDRYRSIPVSGQRPRSAASQVAAYATASTSTIKAGHDDGAPTAIAARPPASGGVGVGTVSRDYPSLPTHSELDPDSAAPAITLTMPLDPSARQPRRRLGPAAAAGTALLCGGGLWFAALDADPNPAPAFSPMSSLSTAEAAPNADAASDLSAASGLSEGWHPIPASAPTATPTALSATLPRPSPPQPATATGTLPAAAAPASAEATGSHTSVRARRPNAVGESAKTRPRRLRPTPQATPPSPSAVAATENAAKRPEPTDIVRGPAKVQPSVVEAGVLAGPKRAPRTTLPSSEEF